MPPNICKSLSAGTKPVHNSETIFSVKHKDKKIKFGFCLSFMIIYTKRKDDEFVTIATSCNFCSGVSKGLENELCKVDS